VSEVAGGESDSAFSDLCDIGAETEDEEYGGAGIRDYKFNAIFTEELVRLGSTGTNFGIHADINIDYILQHGTEYQKQRYVPGMVSGELITAIAMTEPNTGSDLQGIQTTAEWRGNHYVLNGQKTFISNGILSDMVIVAARTDQGRGHHGVGLFCVERDMEGFERGRNLEKVGRHGQDTAELFFRNVKLPKESLLGGEEGQGFKQMMQRLPRERIGCAVESTAACERALAMTIEYCHERQAFGKKIGSFQNSRFKLAEMKTGTTVARHFVDHCIELHNEHKLTPEDAAMAKWWASELEKKTVDQCLQLHGGYGYMMEYPIAKMYLDGRVTTIWAGTTEIMKEIIGRSMGF